jgi:PilZ domain
MSLPKCPACYEDYARRVRREGLIEHLLSQFYVYPFRCQLCGKRFRARQPGVRYIRIDEDRREYERIPVNYDAILSVEREHSEGVVKDISLGGCSVDTRTPLSPGTILQLGLQLPGDRGGITIDAGVVRTSRPGSVGIEFIRFKHAERNRLKDLVRSLHFGNAPPLLLS